MRRLRTAITATTIAAFIAGAPGDARADEPAQARLAARRAMVDGDLPRAREVLRAAPTDVGAAERAAAAELLFVIDMWSPSGRPPAVTGANDAPAPDVEEDWQRAFANARDLLVAGRYAEAARRFDTLVGTAPDLVAGARAAELRALARDAAPNVQPAAPTFAPAHASPPNAEASAEAKIESESRWYGWQTLLSDGLAVVATPLAPPLGIGMYLLGGPIVHIVHLEGFNVLKSLGVRVITPVVGGLVGVAAASGCTGLLCELEGAGWGVVIGAGIAVVVDAALISWEKVPAEKKTATIVPILAPGRVGVGGTF
jgi:hypothetical protein